MLNATLNIRMSEESKAVLLKIQSIEFGEKSQRAFIECAARSFILERIYFFDAVMRDLKTQFYESMKERDGIEAEKKQKTGLELESLRLKSNALYSETAKAWAEIERLQSLINQYIELNNELAGSDVIIGMEGYKKEIVKKHIPETVDEIMARKPTFRLPQEDQE